MDWSKFWEPLVHVAGRYYLVAGTAFLIFYIILRRRFASKKIQPKFPGWKDYGRELFFSTMSVVIFALPPLILIQNDHLRPYTTYYAHIERHGWVYFFAAFPLMFLIHDTYFYWTHRLIHHPKLFRWFHLVHHRSTNPSPWAAYAFHPLEAFTESMIFVIFLFTIPMTIVHLSVFFVLSLTYNVYGHLGFELYPAGFHRHWLGRWINTSVSHNLHHHYFKGNYGLYFLFWDRAMGTMREDYDSAYREVMSRGRGGPTGIGAVVLMLFLAGAISGCHHIETGNTLRGSDIAFIEKLHLLDPGEKIFKFYSEYTRRKSGNFFTDRRMAAYWIDDYHRERTSYSFAFYPDIQSIDTVYYSGLTWCPYMLVTKKDGTQFKVCVEGRRAELKSFFEDALRTWAQKRGR